VDGSLPNGETLKGRRQLAAEEATWSRLSQAVELILGAASQEV
jgi:hypothetical protein